MSDERPFRLEDGDRRFKLAGRPNREWGLLEYPVTAPGTLSAKEAKTMGILWWTYNPGMPHTWRYVTPE